MTAARVLIVDDEPLARERIRTLLPAGQLEIVGESDSVDDAEATIRRFSPDLVFLDIEMPDGTGFDLLSRVDPEEMPLIVFVTAHDSYALRAFDAAAVDYVVKPIDPERLHEALRRALDRLRLGQGGGDHAAQLRGLARAVRALREPARIPLRDSGRTFFVDPRQILWIEAKRNNCLVHLADRTIVVRETLTDLQARLPRATFVRAHRSTVVNLAHVRYADPYSRGEHVLVLSDGTKLVTSRGMGAELRRLL